MSDRNLCPWSVSPPPILALAAGMLLLASSAGAADKKEAPGEIIGKVVNGAILQRPTGQAKFTFLGKGDPVKSGALTVGQPGSQIDSKDGAVQVRLYTDLLGNSPHPILEAAIIPQPASKGFDMELTLDRGRILLINQKKEGPANVRMHFHDQTWDLTLNEPETRVGIDLYGRWPPGVIWHKNAKTPEAPTAVLYLLVLTGSAEVKHGTSQRSMKAPPGPALLQWDSIAGTDPTTRRLEALPEWAAPTEALKERYKKLLPKFEKMSAWVQKLGLEAAAAEARKSGDEDLERSGVVILGAIDDLSTLIDQLNNPKHDIRDHTVMVMRHWIGRSAGQDAKMYAALLKKDYSPAQAETVMQLLHSPGDRQLRSPEWWETLIEYLKSDKVAVRKLAEYHLYRLVPAGKNIKYSSVGTKAEQEAAYKEWKKLIPDGELPPREKPKEK
jgi:hypothetical protein